MSFRSAHHHKAGWLVLWSDRPNPPAEQTASARLAGGPVISEIGSICDVCVTHPVVR